MSDSNNTEQGQELLPAERRARIMEWFATNQVVSTQDLAQSLNSSISTIRRDLDRLASDGLVKRTHGGAVRVRRNTTYEQRSDEARTTSVEEKMAIAGAAVAILQPGESVILDSRSTSHQLAYALAELTIPLTVVTNDVHIAGTLANRDHITLVVPGESADTEPMYFSARQVPDLYASSIVTTISFAARRLTRRAQPIRRWNWCNCKKQWSVRRWRPRL